MDFLNFHAERRNVFFSRKSAQSIRGRDLGDLRLGVVEHHPACCCTLMCIFTRPLAEVSATNILVAMTSETRWPDKCYFPCLHLHDGESFKERDKFAHVLYCQRPGSIPTEFATPSMRSIFSGNTIAWQLKCPDITLWRRLL